MQWDVAKQVHKASRQSYVVDPEHPMQTAGIFRIGVFVKFWKDLFSLTEKTLKACGARAEWQIAGSPCCRRW
jgi:hypothetical protein